MEKEIRNVIGGDCIIREYLEGTKLSIIECLFEKIGTGATIKEIQSSLPRNSKYPEKYLNELMDAKIVVCENPEAPLNERKYEGNRRSKIFTSLFNIDIEISDIEHERKKKLRAQMLSAQKK